jgi:hypothetical protein
MNASIYNLVRQNLRLNMLPMLGLCLSLSLWVQISNWISPGRNNEIIPGIAIIILMWNLFNTKEIIYLSLPYSRNRLLAARYVSAWFVMIAIKAYFILLGVMLGPWLPAFSSFHSEYMLRITQLTEFPLMMLFSIPFGIRIDSRWGFVGGFGLGILVFTVGLVGGRWLFPNANLQDTIRQLLQAMSPAAWMRAAILTAGASIAMLLATLISYSISARIFANKDLG